MEVVNFIAPFRWSRIASSHTQYLLAPTMVWSCPAVQNSDFIEKATHKMLKKMLRLGFIYIYIISRKNGNISSTKSGRFGQIFDSNTYLFFGSGGYYVVGNPTWPPTSRILDFFWLTVEVQLRKGSTNSQDHSLNFRVFMRGFCPAFKGQKRVKLNTGFWVSNFLAKKMGFGWVELKIPNCETWNVCSIWVRHDVGPWIVGKSTFTGWTLKWPFFCRVFFGGHIFGRIFFPKNHITILDLLIYILFNFGHWVVSLQLSKKRKPCCDLAYFFR